MKVKLLICQHKFNIEMIQKLLEEAPPEIFQTCLFVAVAHAFTVPQSIAQSIAQSEHSKACLSSISDAQWDCWLERAIDSDTSQGVDLFSGFDDYFWQHAPSILVKKLLNHPFHREDAASRHKLHQIIHILSIYHPDEVLAFLKHEIKRAPIPDSDTPLSSMAFIAFTHYSRWPSYLPLIESICNRYDSVKMAIYYHQRVT